jgi:two-component system cell cycle response regulator
MMPKIDGFTLLKEIRMQENLKKMPVLILSSRLLNSDETALLEDNNAKVMSKPFDPPRLLDKVREMITESLCTTE